LYSVLGCFHCWVNIVLVVSDVATGDIEELWGRWDTLHLRQWVDQLELLGELNFGEIKLLLGIITFLRYF
jgi:hypothetical protein